MQSLSINTELQLAAAPDPKARGMQPEKGSQIDCGGWPTASVFYLREGVDYLRHVPSKPCS
ncbi:hypothetical protein PG996_003153 [Apiospora saccharicola]|uniref:Uncharacterized protein n=1 Tax=Apiospora saccharicola TaxID=335842 RepID=A0ABR1W4A7_9PEZI